MPPRRLRGPRPGARHQALQARRIEQAVADGNARMASSNADRSGMRQRLDALEARLTVSEQAVAELHAVVSQLKASSLVNPNKP